MVGRASVPALKVDVCPMDGRAKFCESRVSPPPAFLPAKALQYTANVCPPRPQPFGRRYNRCGLSGQAYGKSAVFADVYDSLREPEAAGQCLKCHGTTTGKGGSRRIRWADPRPDARRDTFTQFTHAPHLVKECATCHVFSDNDEAAFVSIPKSTCAECHVQGRTSAGCLNCHVYHVQKTSGGMGRPDPARKK